MKLRIENIPMLYLCPHPLTPSPFLGEGELDSKSLSLLEEGFRVRAAKLECILRI